MKTFLDHTFKGLYYFLTDRNYRTFIRLMLQYGDKKRYVPLKTKAKGYLFQLPDGPSFVWQFHEIFCKYSYRFSTQNKKPIIFDCGANVGTSCIFFKEEYPGSTVHAFEPDPNVFEYLEKNITKNKIEDIILHNAAVWKENGTLDFSSEGADGGAIGSEGKNTVTVKTIRLKEMLLKENKIDLLKIDIEGAEVEVIADCEDALGHVENIFIEYHSFNGGKQHLEKILAVLNKNGFRYYTENESSRRIPFMDKTGKYAMDMQVNIFGYRM